MKRFASILLLIAFLGLGSGALSYFHELQHQAEDAADQAAGRNSPPHHHDESNCPTCAQLHMLFTAGGWVSVLICLGTFIAFLIVSFTPLVPRRVPARLDCRGPPALLPAL